MPTIKRFMLDIETTGLDPETDDILEIGALELDFENGFYRAKNSLRVGLPSAKTPKDDFSRKQQAIYDASNHLDKTLSDEMKMSFNTGVRTMLLGFFAKAGCVGKQVMLIGKNLEAFDLKFLYKHHILNKNDHHYRIYNVGSAIIFVNDMQENLQTYEELGKEAEVLVKIPEHSGQPHTALADCYIQTRILNGLMYKLKRFVYEDLDETLYETKEGL